MRPLVLAALIAATVGCGGRPSYPPTTTHPLLGQPLPAIRHRQTLDGRAFDAAQLAGKPVVVKFFADYCKPCKESLPAAERVHSMHPDVAFLGIDLDESGETAHAVVARFGLTFPVIHDASNVLSGRFRVSSLPMTFVADAAGVIRWVGDESQTEPQLRQAVEAAR